jgi:putative long chain acyl-CoA synthase
LPGADEVKVAAWDLDKERLIEASSGFADEAKVGEVGLLVARVDPARGEIGTRPLRGVFESGDAWLNTGDLVRRDEEGDFWLVDHVADVIHGPVGGVATRPIEERLAAALDWIDGVAVYGVKRVGSEEEVPVAALTIRPGRRCDEEALRRSIQYQLLGPQRPVAVRILDELPVTAGHRTRKRVLRTQGLDSEALEGRTLWLIDDAVASDAADASDHPESAAATS